MEYIELSNPVMSPLLHLYISSNYFFMNKGEKKKSLILCYQPFDSNVINRIYFQKKKNVVSRTYW